MSPRAAWRLETLGFEQVYWYAGGKADWMASGLPIEGSEARIPRIGDHARRDVPTCGPDERVADVRARVRAAKWNTCFVVTAERVVLGRLHNRELDGDGAQRASDVMRSGPSTFRPDVTVHDMLEHMREHKLTTAPVTTSDGTLIGLALIEELEAAHGGVSARTSSRRRGWPR